MTTPTFPEYGRLYHHYKGGLYMALAESVATDDIKKGDVIVNYRHQGGDLYSRPLGGSGGWMTPVEGLVRPRFLLIPASFRLNLENG